jgi:hypothetical protein
MAVDEKPQAPAKEVWGFRLSLGRGARVMRQSCSDNPVAMGMFLLVINLVAFGASECLCRLGSLRFGHDVRPQTPVRQIVEVEDFRGAAVIESDFIAAAVSNSFVLSEVYIGHAPMPRM